MIARGTKPICIIIISILCTTIRAEEILLLHENGERMNCVGDREARYCLSLPPQPNPPRESIFQCYLKGQLVYGCSATKCSGHGLLQAQGISNFCHGIPFTEVKSEMTGTYTCRMADSSHSFEYNLQLCKDTQTVELKLRKGENNVGCLQVGTPDVDNYCLQVCSRRQQQQQHQPQPQAQQQQQQQHPGNFTCFLNNTKVYSCTSKDQCQGEGVLAGDRTVWKDIWPECVGIHFNELDIHLMGRYTCCVKNLGCQHLDLYPCTHSGEGAVPNNTSNSTTRISNTPKTPSDASTEDTSDNKSWLPGLIAGLALVVVVAAVAGIVFCLYKKKQLGSGDGGGGRHSAIPHEETGSPA